MTGPRLVGATSRQRGVNAAFFMNFIGNRLYRLYMTQRHTTWTRYRGNIRQPPAENLTTSGIFPWRRERKPGQSEGMRAEALGIDEKSIGEQTVLESGALRCHPCDRLLRTGDLRFQRRSFEFSLLSSPPLRSGVRQRTHEFRMNSMATLPFDFLAKKIHVAPRSMIRGSVLKLPITITHCIKFATYLRKRGHISYISKFVQKYALTIRSTLRTSRPNLIIRNTRINTRITYFRITYFTPMLLR